MNLFVQAIARRILNPTNTAHSFAQEKWLMDKSSKWKSRFEIRMTSFPSFKRTSKLQVNICSKILWSLTDLQKAAINAYPPL